jgi:hypothetical protein
MGGMFPELEVDQNLAALKMFPDMGRGYIVAFPQDTLGRWVFPPPVAQLDRYFWSKMPMAAAFVILIGDAFASTYVVVPLPAPQQKRADARRLGALDPERHGPGLICPTRDPPSPGSRASRLTATLWPIPTTASEPARNATQTPMEAPGATTAPESDLASHQRFRHPW